MSEGLTLTPEQNPPEGAPTDVTIWTVKYRQGGERDRLHMSSTPPAGFTASDMRTEIHAYYDDGSLYFNYRRTANTLISNFGSRSRTGVICGVRMWYENNEKISKSVVANIVAEFFDLPGEPTSIYLFNPLFYLPPGVPAPQVFPEDGIPPGYTYIAPGPWMYKTCHWNAPNDSITEPFFSIYYQLPSSHDTSDLRLFAETDDYTQSWVSDFDVAANSVDDTDGGQRVDIPMSVIENGAQGHNRFHIELRFNHPAENTPTIDLILPDIVAGTPGDCQVTNVGGGNGGWWNHDTGEFIPGQEFTPPVVPQQPDAGAVQITNVEGRYTNDTPTLHINYEKPSEWTEDAQFSTVYKTYDALTGEELRSGESDERVATYQSIGLTPRGSGQYITTFAIKARHVGSNGEWTLWSPQTVTEIHTTVWGDGSGGNEPIPPVVQEPAPPVVLPPDDTPPRPVPEPVEPPPVDPEDPETGFNLPDPLGAFSFETIWSAVGGGTQGGTRRTLEFIWQEDGLPDGLRVSNWYSDVSMNIEIDLYREGERVRRLSHDEYYFSGIENRRAVTGFLESLDDLEDGYYQLRFVVWIDRVYDRWERVWHDTPNAQRSYVDYGFTVGDGTVDDDTAKPIPAPGDSGDNGGGTPIPPDGDPDDLPPPRWDIEIGLPGGYLPPVHRLIHAGYFR